MEIQKFTNILQHSITESIPVRDINLLEDRLPAGIIEMIKDKNKIRRLWQTTRMSFYKKQLKRKQNAIRLEIHKHKNKKWQQKLSKLNIHDKSLWRMTKIFKKEYTPIPALTKNNIEATTNIEKANMLATQFEQVHAVDIVNNSEKQKEIEETVEQYLATSSTTNSWKEYISSPHEIQNIIKNLPSKKAPRFDKIQNVIFKKLTRKALAQLTYIINTSIRLSYFSKHWKTANVIPTYKTGKNKEDPSSYPPISLLSKMSKILEKIVHLRLTSFENKNNIIIDHQFGFRQKHNTVQQLVRIVNDISINFNLNKVTVMLLLDIEKAFDRVWIDGLIYKMIHYKYPSTFIKFISSYLRDRHLKVTVNGETSMKRKIRVGVPQGSVLSPKLFNIYLNDIPIFPKTKTALFADDTALYAHSHSANIASKQIQIHMRMLEKFYDQWKITLNAAKTEVITFSKKCNANNRIIEPIQVKGFKTTPKTCVKYLGVHLDNKLTYRTHIAKALQKVYSVQRKLYPLLSKKSSVSYENKLTIYKTILRPTFIYASPVWCNAAPTNLKKLQVLQNKYLRLILSESRYARIKDMHDQTNIMMVSEYIKQTAEHFYSDSLNSNPLTENINKTKIYNLPFTLKHKLPYGNLNIFRE